MDDLRGRAIRGGFAKVCAQLLNFAVRVGSIAALARILTPSDFGIIGMVTALTGVLDLLRDFGLSAAAVQRPQMTDEQASTLFWLNIGFGSALALLVAAAAPVLVGFYHERRLFWVTITLSTAFIFSAAGVQHSAVLQRQMRFSAIARADIGALLLCTSVGIGTALLGFKYWALVLATVSRPLAASTFLWLTTRWIPGRPHVRAGLRPIVRFGGTLTLNSIVMYIACNLEKVLVGRFWGAAVLGIYGRAFQLISIPTDNLNSAVGDVAFSALSRIQDSPSIFRSYFLKSYSLVLALTIPITLSTGLFSPDVVAVFLGSKWSDAVPILRLLSPTIFVLAVINPLGWLMFSLGKVGRSLKAALVFAPILVGGYIVALPYGPNGVAFAYSAVMVMSVVPLIAWCVHGTVISVRDIAVVAGRPLISGMAAVPIAVGVHFCCGRSLPTVARFLLEGTALVVAYAGMLLYVMGQKTFYVGLLNSLLGRRAIEPTDLTPP